MKLSAYSYRLGFGVLFVLYYYNHLIFSDLNFTQEGRENSLSSSGCPVPKVWQSLLLNFPFAVLFCLWLKRVKGVKKSKVSIYHKIHRCISRWLAHLIVLDHQLIGQIIITNEHHLREGFSISPKTFPITLFNSLVHKCMQLMNINMISTTRICKSVVLNPYTHIPKKVSL